MPFHRLTTPTYYLPVPWPPVGYDYINNDPAAPFSQAPADGAKAGGSFPGTYFIDFGEDAESLYGNRAHRALAENTDFLDNILSSSIPKVTYRDSTPLFGINNTTITGEVFVGEAGTPDTLETHGRLFSVVDPNTMHELVLSTGIRVYVNAVDDGGGLPVVGNGFQTNPRIFFNTPIPAGVQYRVIYGERSSFAGISTGTPPTLSGLLGESIRSAHLIPGEVLRVLLEAFRRVGGDGAVDAIQLTKIETPSGSNPLAFIGHNFIDVEVDTNADFVDGGVFNVAFSGGSNIFSVRETSGFVPSCWSSDFTIRFQDVNTLMMASPRPVPLTEGLASDGARFPRLIESDPSTIGIRPSLMRLLNAKFKVTVGDGVNSFGDFNGASAITEVLSAFSGLGSPATILHIQVKEGVYNSFHTSSIPSNLVLEGMGTSSIVFLNGNISLNSIVIRDLYLQNTVAGAVSISASNFVKVERSYVYDITLQVAPTLTNYNTYACYLKDSRLRQQYGPAVHIRPSSDGVVTSGVKAEGCFFTMTGEHPPMRISTNLVGLGDTADVNDVVFEDCQLKLFGCSSVGGNLSENVGAVDIEHPAIGPVLTVHDLVFVRCRVEANWFGASQNSILLYLRGFNGTSAFTLNHLRIEGGRWTCPGQDTEIAPLYVGGWQASSTGYRPNKVTIRDVQWGFESGTYTTAVPHGTFAAEVGVGKSSTVASFYISADNLVINNLSFFRTIRRLGDSVSACDLMLGGAKSYDVDGIFIENIANDFAPAAADPDYRVVIAGDSPFGSNGSISRLVIDGTGNAEICDIAALMAVSNGSLVLKDCTFRQLGTGGSGSAIHIFSGTLDEANGFELHDSLIKNVPGLGVFLSLDPAHDDVTGVTIRGCDIDNCLVGAALVSELGGQYITDVRVQDNIIHNCSSYGLWYAPGAALKDCFVITNNTIKDNNSGLTHTQILFGRNGAAVRGASLGGILVGNNCGYDGADNGIITFYIKSTPPSAVPYPGQVLDSSTAYQLNVGLVRWWGFVSPTSSQVIIDGELMFRNLARIALIEYGDPIP